MIFAACSFLTLAALIYIFWAPPQLELASEKSRVAYLSERKDVVYENLRDLNFEYKAGKFPEADYQSMKATLEEEAAKLLAEISDLEMHPGDSDAAPGQQQGRKETRN